MSSLSAGAHQRAADLLDRRVDRLQTPVLLDRLIREEFPRRLAVVSSFGVESVVLLHIVAAIDPFVPVIFLNTGKLFAETLAYRDEVVRRLGLGDVRDVGPDPREVAAADPDGGLWARDPDGCCGLRKRAPLLRALDGFDAWLTGRKRYQSGERGGLEVIEEADGRIKINPLALWSREEIETHCEIYRLPRHPLIADGYPSIGCVPCTTPVASNEDPRAGRWRGLEKSECGIHWVGGKPVRAQAS